MAVPAIGAHLDINHVGQRLSGAVIAVSTYVDNQRDGGGFARNFVHIVTLSNQPADTGGGRGAPLLPPSFPHDAVRGAIPDRGEITPLWSESYSSVAPRGLNGGVVGGTLYKWWSARIDPRIIVGLGGPGIPGEQAHGYVGIGTYAVAGTGYLLEVEAETVDIECAFTFYGEQGGIFGQTSTRPYADGKWRAVSGVVTTPEQAGPAYCVVSPIGSELRVASLTLHCFAIPN